MTGASKVQLRLGERVVAEVAFEGEELRIGRMKENDLVINNLAVSRFHAVLRRVGNGFEIEDLGSENGTLVEGQPICGSAGVAPGVPITIGKHTLFLREGGQGTTQQPLPRKSDVWDAAQTYFVAGPVDSAHEEPVAEAREEDEVADAVEAEGWEPEVGAEEVAVDAAAEVLDAAVAASPEHVDASITASAEDLEAAVGASSQDVEAAVVASTASPESPSAEPSDALESTALPALESTALPAFESAALLAFEPVSDSMLDAADEVVESSPAIDEIERARPAQEVAAPVEPQALELPAPESELGFGEDELVGGAMPDPIAAEAPSAIVEAEEVPTPVTEVAFGVESQRGPDVLESAGQTSLFDFGLTDDLGLSERSLARSGDGEAEPAAAKLHAGLIVEREGRVHCVMPWSEGRIRVGRAPDCDLVLAGSGVSRRHAELTREGPSHAVRDLGSANGVFVNGTRVDHVTLQQGDVIHIDDYALTFVLDHEPVGGSVRSVEVGAGAAGMEAGVAEPTAAADAGEEAMPERDLVLAEDVDLELGAGEKQLDEAVALEAEPVVWRVEVAIATERLPEAVRRALAEVDAAELVLPAQIRLVRGDDAA